MKNHTVTITVNASFNEVFDFLADVRNLPLWATHFAKSVRCEDERWYVATPKGELLFAIDVNKPAGVIDMFAGPTAEAMESFPVRIMKIDNGETAAIFSLFRSDRPGMTDTMFEGHYRALVEECGLLVERFGGGEVSFERMSVPNVYPGFVTNELSETRDFYVTHFGFQPVFDGPFYVHLLRPEGGEQLGLMGVTSLGDGSHAEMEKATSGEGVWLSIEVADVNAEFERLKASGVALRQGLIDQPWGERTFVVQDPNGVLIYVAQKIDTIDEELKQYFVEAGADLVSR